FIVMIVHEAPKSIVAHCVMHPLYKSSHKINTNPLKYIDPIGLIMFALLGVGWQKPYEYNSTKYKDKSKGILAVALTGLIANLVFMAVLIPMAYIPLNGYVHFFIFTLIYFNFSITFVNLLPVPPLEMAKIIHSFSHNAYFKLMQNERIIHTVFIFLIVFDVVRRIVVTSYIAFRLPTN
ncbi:MAG: site-2 protease family protein, partial [Vallitaleaceae bacterium]|nr:site-2 protease family protein [Vallitaleaceae bacterium]